MQIFYSRTTTSKHQCALNCMQPIITVHCSHLVPFENMLATQ